MSMSDELEITQTLVSALVQSLTVISALSTLASSTQPPC